MTSHSLIPSLREQLSGPLPGWQAQWELASLPGRPRIAPDNHRKGGVLSLLYPHGEELFLVLMKRTEDGRVHSGQISFPGGRMEPHDPDLRMTALREAEEELGIPITEVEVLGSLTELYIQASNFLVQPVVGYAAKRPNFRPSAVEVEEVVEIPLKTLLETPPAVTPVTVASGFRLDARAFLVDHHVIWGATAMMLNELLTVIRDISS